MWGTYFYDLQLPHSSAGAHTGAPLRPAVSQYVGRGAPTPPWNAATAAMLPGGAEPRPYGSVGVGVPDDPLPIKKEPRRALF